MTAIVVIGLLVILAAIALFVYGAIKHGFATTWHTFVALAVGVIGVVLAFWHGIFG